MIYRRVGETDLSATLYTHVGPGPFPANVEVHGGVRNLYDRHRNARLCEFLATAGIMVMALDFRVSPDVYPASVQDVNAGIRRLKRHVAAQGGAPLSVGA